MQEINLYDLLKHYAKYWLFIVAFSFMGLIAGLIYNNAIQAPMYKSNATLLVLNTTGSTEAKTTTINNYLELLKSRRVLEPVLMQLNLNKSYEQLVGSVTTTNDKNTEVVKLTIATANPEQSKKIVDATITSFKDEVKRLYNTENIQVIDSANLPNAPYNVRKTIQLVLFTAAGFLLSIIVVFFIYDFKLSNTKTNNTKAPKPITEPISKTKTVKPKQATVFARYKLRRSANKAAKATHKAANKQQNLSVKGAKRDPKTGRFAAKTTNQKTINKTSKKK